MRNEELIVSHMKYAFGIVNHRRWTFLDHEREDADSEALLALSVAGDRFDPERGVPFAAWVQRRIAGALDDWAVSKKQRYGLPANGRGCRGGFTRQGDPFVLVTEANGGACADRHPGSSQALGAALKAIPERVAFVLRQRYVIGEACEDIAAFLGVSPGRVSQLSKLGLRLMREELALRGVRKVADLV